MMRSCVPLAGGDARKTFSIVESSRSRLVDEAVWTTRLLSGSRAGVDDAFVLLAQE